MKKILLLFSLIIFAFALSLNNFSSIVYADSSRTYFDFTLTTRQNIIDFVYGDESKLESGGERIDRTSASDQEFVAATYLYDKLVDLLKTEQTETIDNEEVRINANDVAMQEFVASTGISSVVESRNVIGLIPSKTQTNDIVIIGAHYDNSYALSTSTGGEQTKSHGIYDNASGVAAMLNLVQIFMQDEYNNLPFNLMFVFYGAEELGCIGSAYFYKSLNDKVKDNILLSINLDSIGVGDHLYMYTDEVSRIHQSYFVEISKGLALEYSKYNETIKEPPKNKKVSYLTSIFGIGYAHMGLASDNAIYVANGKNSINFFSAAWDASGFGHRESTLHENITHTTNDRLVFIEEVYGNTFYNRIDKVTLVVANALMQTDFVDVMDESANQSKSYLFFVDSMYIKLILAGVIIISYFAINNFTKTKQQQIPTNYEELKKAVLENNIAEIKNKNKIN